MWVSAESLAGAGTTTAQLFAPGLAVGQERKESNNTETTQMIATGLVHVSTKWPVESISAVLGSQQSWKRSRAALGFQERNRAACWLFSALD